jgi:hypothetical protein
MAFVTSHKNIATLLAEKRLQRENLDNEIKILEQDELDAWAACFNAPTEQEDVYANEDEYDDEYDDSVFIRSRFTKKRKFEDTKEAYEVISIYDKNRRKEKRAKIPSTRNIANHAQKIDIRNEIIALKADKEAERQMEREEWFAECDDTYDDHFQSYMDYYDMMGKIKCLEEKRLLKKKEKEREIDDVYIEESFHSDVTGNLEIKIPKPKRFSKKIKPKKGYSLQRDLKIVKEKRSKLGRDRSRTHQHGDRDWSENNHGDRDWSENNHGDRDWSENNHGDRDWSENNHLVV